VCLLLASAIAASAQVEIVPIEGRDAALAETGFKLAPSGSTMKCAIKPTVPELNFKLLYDAGFKMTFPLDPRLGPSRSLNIFLRVRSADAREKPAYLAARYRLPGGPLTDLGMLTGHFALTPGSWSVEALAVDSEGKVCRADWRTEIKSVAAPHDSDRRGPGASGIWIDWAGGPRYVSGFAIGVAAILSRTVDAGDRVQSGR
jgi:hypothetical protein